MMRIGLMNNWNGKGIDLRMRSNKGNEAFHPFHFAPFGTIMEREWNMD